MSYINFELLRATGLSGLDYVLLQCCRQQKFEKLGDYLSDLCGGEPEALLQLEDRGLVEFIKGEKKDSFFDRARNSKAGNKVLDTLGVSGVTPEDEKIWDWLERKFRAKDKNVGNAKKGKFYLAQFRVQSGIDKNKLAILCNKYIKDEKRMEFSQVLEYVFFKPVNMYSAKFDLEQSKLWQYYLDHKQMFDKEFEKL
jgi:hypothetical protein